MIYDKVFSMDEDRRKLELYIRQSDERVKNWSSAQQDAFREATDRLNLSEDSAPNSTEGLKSKAN